jgi:uncharacterized Zn finger protein
VFNYCVQEALNEKYVGWDWGWDLAEVAAGLVSTTAQRAALFTTLDRMVVDRHKHREESWSIMYPRPKQTEISDYDAEHAEEIKLIVVQRLDGPKAVEAFLKERLEKPHFRQALVQFYIEQEQLAEAKRLCNEYLESSGERMQGIQINFQALLLVIAQKANDTGEALRLARMLFVRTGEFAYYGLLKQMTPSNDWESALRQLIPELKGHYYDHIVPEIYLREEKWDDLLAAVREAHPGLVEHYRKHLESRFPAAMCDIYERIALATLSERANRQGYQVACKYLRRMQKLGQKERIEKQVQTLKEKYKNRPALLDELKKL